METEHGNINRSNTTDSINTDDCLDSNRVPDDLELDKETSKKPRPKMHRIVTDCC